MKRTTVVASALCLAMAAFSSLAEDKMGNGEKSAMEHDSMGKPEAKRDKREKTDKMGKTEKHDKMEKHDQMDRMEKPDAMR